MPLTYDKTIREGESHSGLLENKLELCQGGVDLTPQPNRLGCFLIPFHSRERVVKINTASVQWEATASS